MPIVESGAFWRYNISNIIASDATILTLYFQAEYAIKQYRRRCYSAISYKPQHISAKMAAICTYQAEAEQTPT